MIILFFLNSLNKIGPHHLQVSVSNRHGKITENVTLLVQPASDYNSPNSTSQPTDYSAIFPIVNTQRPLYVNTPRPTFGKPQIPYFVRPSRPPFVNSPNPPYKEIVNGKKNF